jgi:hypothetical protein
VLYCLPWVSSIRSPTVEGASYQYQITIEGFDEFIAPLVPTAEAIELKGHVLCDDVKTYSRDAAVPRLTVQAIKSHSFLLGSGSIDTSLL